MFGKYASFIKRVSKGKLIIFVLLLLALLPSASLADVNGAYAFEYETMDKCNNLFYVYANYENLKDITQGALYYHADYVNPRWKLEKTTVIGRHIFYKESGKRNDDKNESATEGRTVKTFFYAPDGGDYSYQR
jgi:hypothetical protein